MIAELTLAISAVKSVGQAIDSAKSLIEVAGQLDEAFTLTDKAKRTKKPKGATEVLLEDRLGKFEGNTDGESTSFAAIAQEVTDAKALTNELFRLKTRLDLKWGPGTYNQIIDTRNERLEKQERLKYEHQQLLRQRKKDRKHFYLEMLKGIGLLLFIAGAMYWLMQSY
jgi:hypothetical protein